MSNDANIFNFNVGWTKCSAALRLDDIKDSIEEYESNIVVLTEVSNKGNIQMLQRQLSREGARYECITDKIGYDMISILYNTDHYKGVDNSYEPSVVGKYLKKTLEAVGSGEIFPIFAVHSPRKKGRVKSLKLLADASNTKNSIIVGDLNTTPSQLPIVFRRRKFKFAVTDDEDLTTDTASLDNVITRSGSFSEVEVLPDKYGSDHYPVVQSGTVSRCGKSERSTSSRRFGGFPIHLRVSGQGGLQVSRDDMEILFHCK